MANVGPIQALSWTKNGDKVWVTVGGVKYLCKDTAIGKLPQGTVISFQSHAWTTQDGKKLFQIDDWSTSGETAPVTHPGVPPEHQHAVARLKPTVDPDALMRYCSNVVGQAIAAKTITKPQEIREWFQAARNSVKSPPKVDEVPPEDFDDNIPF